MKDKSLTEVFYELAEKWETMTEIEKDHLAGDISGTRNIETRTFEEKFGRLTAMWRKMNAIEQESFSYVLFGNSAKDFQSYINMICKAIKFADGIVEKTENCSMD